MNQLEELYSFYENEGKEELRLVENGFHYLERLTASHYLNQVLKPNSRILDSCAGSGVYALDLVERGHRVTAGDIVPRNVELIKQAAQKNHSLEEIYCGDALDLSRFGSESFDAVLCMGALYHLDEEKDRRRVLEESVRVLRPGGFLFCTYMNRYAVILNNTVGSVENIQEILSFSKEGKEGIFYASTPEESQALMADLNLEIMNHVALDGISNFLYATTGRIDEEGLHRWYDYHFSVCEVPSLLGYSYHNLLIGRKRAV